MDKNTVETYEREKIGKCLSWVGDHIVYEYGENFVIKFSKSDYLLGTMDKSLGDYALSLSYFGKYILESKIVRSPSGRYYGTIQPKVGGDFFCLSHMNDPHLKGQFTELIAGYDRMIADGKGELDLIGYGGVFRDCFSNILIAPDNRLTIIDTSIMEMKGHYLNPVTYIFTYLIRPIALSRQHFTIKKFRKLL